ncbi:MAG: amidohydrolase family protein [Phycisphaerae bacterium]
MPQKRRPLQGRAVGWSRDPGATLRWPPATLEQAFSLQSCPRPRSCTQTALRFACFFACGIAILACHAPTAWAQVAVRGERVYTAAGPAIHDGVVVIENGKITAVGPASEVAIPEGVKVFNAKVVTPGFVDAHSTIGVSGILNYAHDQDQLEHSAPMQPQLRALDAYNCREALVAYARGFGVTTVHTGHAPGELISGQTIVVKTFGNTVDDALVLDSATIAATLDQSARKTEKGKSPGTRGKMMALMRQELIKAKEYLRKRAAADEKENDGNSDDDERDKKPTARDLELEALGRLLDKEVPLMITANRAQDIANALRLKREFDLRLILDGAAESYLLVNEIKKLGVGVFIHPSMARSFGGMKNMSFETAATLVHAGIAVGLQSGYESYVPKTRVLVFEAGIAAANGLTFDEALATITVTPARILGVDRRVGSLEVGKDGDVALFDGDPFEYTTHCIAVIGEGVVVSNTPQ